MTIANVTSLSASSGHTEPHQTITIPIVSVFTRHGQISTGGSRIGKTIGTASIFVYLAIMVQTQGMADFMSYDVLEHIDVVARANRYKEMVRTYRIGKATNMISFRLTIESSHEIYIDLRFCGRSILFFKEVL